MMQEFMRSFAVGSCWAHNTWALQVGWLGNRGSGGPPSRALITPRTMRHEAWDTLFSATSNSRRTTTNR